MLDLTVIFKIYTSITPQNNPNCPSVHFVLFYVYCDPRNKINYRPISVLQFLNKIFKSLACTVVVHITSVTPEIIDLSFILNKRLSSCTFIIKRRMFHVVVMFICNSPHRPLEGALVVSTVRKECKQ